jgi:hypothetical protein
VEVSVVVEASAPDAADFSPPPQEKARPARSTTTLVARKFSFIGLIWFIR